MPVAIRPANPDDIESLVTLWRGFMEFHADHDPAFSLAPGAAEVRRKFLQAQLTDADTFVQVAIVEGKAVGYVLGGIRMRPPVFAFPRFGHISDLYVVPSHQRTGLGTRFLEECLAWFKERDIGRIEVRTLTSNPVSNAFWARHGFSPFAQESFRQIDG